MRSVVERRPGQGPYTQFDTVMSAAELDELLRKGITVNLVEINQIRSKARIHVEAPWGALILRSELHERASPPHQKKRPGHSSSPDERFGMEESQGQGSEEVPGAFSAPCPSWICFDPRSRSEAHLRPKTSGCWGKRGKQEGPAGPQERQHFQSSLGDGVRKLIDEDNKISATDSRGRALKILSKKAG